MNSQLGYTVILLVIFTILLLVFVHDLIMPSALFISIVELRP